MVKRRRLPVRPRLSRWRWARLMRRRPPFIYWDVKNASGNPVGGATFTIAYRSWGSWNGTTTVVDCTAFPCTGSDLDPDPGEFLVKQFDGHNVVTGTRYRITQQSGQFSYGQASYERPSGSSNYQKSIGDSGGFNNAHGQRTHGFGTFVQRFVSVNPMPNPALPNQCGLSIALVFDLSNSLTVSDVTNSKKAGVAFIDALEGTPSSVGIYSFATFAPAGSNTNLPATSVATDDGADVVRAHINGLSRPDNAQGGTNWDAGLGQVAGGYDMVVFITDGKPTAYGTPGSAPPGNDDYGTGFDQIDLDTAILRANDLKSNGAFVMGLGVGSGVDEENIKDVSGDIEGTDYYLVANYGALEEQLEELARKNCRGSVSVTKQIVDADGEIIDSSPAGWFFTATTTDAVLVADNESLVSSLERVTDEETGAVNFRLNLGTDPTASRTVAINETQQDGYELVRQNGFNAVCEASGAPVPVTNSGDLGFDVDVKVDSIVACTVLNQEPPKHGALTIEKKYLDVPAGTADDASFTGTYSCYIGGDETAAGTWTASGEGPAILTAASGSVPTNQIPVGSSCTVTETGPDNAALPNTSWEWGTPTIEYPADADSAVIVANETANVVVTNTAERVYGNFEIAKIVDGIADLDLEYSGDWQCVLGDETVTGEWGPIKDGETWRSDVAHLIPLGAECSVVNENGRPDVPVADDPSYSWDGEPTIGEPVTAATQASTIIVTNTTLRELGSVEWTKVDDSGAKLSGSEWELAGPYLFNDGDVLAITDCTADTCAGPDADPEAGVFQIEDLPWGEYTLTETKAPAGYYLNSDPITFTIGKEDPASLEVTLDPVENERRDPPALPLTGGMSRDFFMIVGPSILLLGVGGMGYAHLRKNRREVA